MFDIGWSELVVIGVVALIVIGPKELPSVLRTLGQGMSKIRRMASEFQGQFQDAIREAELDELRKQAEKLSSEATSAASFDPVAQVKSELQAAIEPPAAPPPQTTADADMNSVQPSADPAAGGGGRAA